MKYTVAIAAFAAVAAAQSSSTSTTSSPSRTSAITNTNEKPNGNTDIPYPIVTPITPKHTDISALTKVAEELLSDLSTFASSLTAQAAYSEFNSAVRSVAAKSETSELFATDGILGHTNLINSLATATPTWWTKLPTSAQAYYTSIAAEEFSIVSKDFLGPAAPTAAPVMKAAGVAAAGALAGAALLL